MTIIRVDPTLLRDSACAVVILAHSAEESAKDLLQVPMQAPSYEGQFRPQVEVATLEAQFRIRSLAGRMQGNSSYLAAKAEAFEQVDSDFRREIVSLGSALERVLHDGFPSPLLDFLNWTGAGVVSLLALGGLSVGLGHPNVPISMIPGNALLARITPDLTSLVLTLLKKSSAGRMGLRTDLKVLGLQRLYDGLKVYVPKRSTSSGAALKRLNPLAKVVGPVLGTAFDYDLIKGDDILRAKYSAVDDRDAFGIAASKNVVETFLAIEPHVMAALFVNGVVQVGGKVWVWANEKAIPMITDSDGVRNDLAGLNHKMEDDLRNVDLGNLTGDLGAVVDHLGVQPIRRSYDTYSADPSLQNAWNLFVSVSNAAPPSWGGELISDPEMQAVLAKDAANLILDIMKVGGGVLDGQDRFNRQITTYALVGIDRIGGFGASGTASSGTAHAETIQRLIHEIAKRPAPSEIVYRVLRSDQPSLFSPYGQAQQGAR